MLFIEGGVDAFDALLYPEQNPNNDFYIQQQLNNFSQTLTHVGRQFIEGAKTVYEQLNSPEALRAAKAALRAARGYFTPNTIMYLDSLEAMQAAKSVMQRWIMAQPDVRDLYLAQRCAGYHDEYTNVFGNTRLDDNYDYRRVMDAIAVDDDDGWYVRYYPDDILDGDKELNFIEKVEILSTWDIVKMFVDAGKDPTDPYGGSL
jgi:hypothetical protein